MPRPALVCVALLTACGTQPPPARPLALLFPIDTLRTQTLGSGLSHSYYWSGRGPWAIHVLTVELDSCWSAVAVKGMPGAVGREKTSALVARAGGLRRPAAGVNADFFLFSPPGVPTGAMISNGTVVTGPSAQPVLAFDSSGMPRITVLRARGQLDLPGATYAIDAWNRGAPDGLALYDTAWGKVMDTAGATVEVLLRGRDPARVSGIDTAPGGAAIPADGFVLLAGRNAPAALRAALLGLEPGAAVRIRMALEPFHPREAVGGRPVLVEDSAVSGAVDTEGRPGFADRRHPRTAAGLARGGKRLILVAVDGRQAPYSDGMTLRELAELLRALGAREAINLDGGGSTTLVYPAPGGPPRVGNRPSDPGGERPVGNALAVVRECRPA
ncbi:MAG TPA: phosphodiester glycosidase family protein [Gemmatimonadales bacterium]|nr:phosphodiester glycosidase family protein [Gemmatimonadales bacterium]